ncbi:MAG: hypothetical protein AAB353_00455, partial [Candidatus Hydrogenedentota bacterium]
PGMALVVLGALRTLRPGRKITRKIRNDPKRISGRVASSALLCPVPPGGAEWFHAAQRGASRPARHALPTLPEGGAPRGAPPDFLYGARRQ